MFVCVFVFVYTCMCVQYVCLSMCTCVCVCVCLSVCERVSHKKRKQCQWSSPITNGSRRTSVIIYDAELVAEEKKHVLYMYKGRICHSIVLLNNYITVPGQSPPAYTPDCLMPGTAITTLFLNVEIMLNFDKQTNLSTKR